ncbi:MAG: hypothetical protein MUF49_21165 [Oculatellaceae cyanobacterium Prado106]|jgi:hypothetical protein|nr:hypothetical protein [Oculatellaceae cyanobacterium Prado106]
MPKFANTLAWEQAELLMQPVFIRVIDNLGKALEQSSWKGTYQEVQIWPEGVSEETQQTVLHLQQQLAAASPETATEIQTALEQLPSPHPSYLLCLQHDQRQITVDIWQLCYQICFRNYSPVLNALDQNLVVEIDTSLIDETGDVDWQRLDDKTKQIVEQIFSSLSGAEVPEPSETGEE